ncbi:hypothetical protein L6164_022883 [Bauhinia variegata]|uniref:Uncharacterized protein n=1 Tax=Bauhinia variegata TaxID=167791 RepID=A0ACB9MGG2_BAUVA|nr:hypothetical protein L6164_022883 [Bauhinia variegata]
MHRHYHNSPIWSLSSPLHSKLLCSPVSFSIRHYANGSCNRSQQLKVDVRACKRPEFRLKGSKTSKSRASESVEVSNEICWVNGIRKRVDAIKLMLGSMDEGEESISASAYHTAWVALVEDFIGRGAPQFPSSLQWIINNQLPDGSWGDSGIFLAYDRLLCTLACVIALRFWNVHSEKSDKVPDFYPIDLFERIWAVDRLERLGISRYFQQEIIEFMNYVHRYWNKKGIGWTRFSEFPDIDDTAMGFRLLRLHGHQVSAREEVLEDAKNITTKILTEKRASNQLLDKWIIAKDIAGEVSFALDIPWYMSLPRIETRFYLEQYGGEDDVWISKTLYRWYSESGLEQFGLSREKILLVYFLAAASIFEPERSQERWLNTKKSKDELVGTLLGTLRHLSLGSPITCLEIIHDIWKKWLWRWESEGDSCQGEAELLIKMIHLKAGYIISQEQEHSPEYQQLCQLANGLCYRLRYISKSKERVCNGSWKMNKSGISRLEIESEMQELVKLVLQSSSNGIDSNINNTFLIVTKSFYYLAYCDPNTINFHIAKVLFEPVV